MTKKDLGLASVERVFREMAIDEEWSVREARGFTWWGAWVRERVWADKAVRADGETLSHVRARTPAYRDQPDEPATYAQVGAMNDWPGLSACVYDPEDRTVSARCGAFIYDQVAGWLGHFFVSAVALQASIAWLQVPEMANGRALDDESHPTSGPRRDPDDMLNLVGRFPKTRSPFTRQVLRDAARALAGEGCQATFVDEDACLSVVVPSSENVAAWWRLSSEEHPAYGAGALVRLFVPFGTGPLRAAWLANALNLGEASDWHGEHRPHALGAWTVGDGVLVHTAFLPSVLVADADRDDAILVIRNLLAWGSVRARFAGYRLPWLDAAAISRYPDDGPPEAAPEAADAGGSEPGSASGDPANDRAEKHVPAAERPFGPAARTPRTPRPRSAPDEPTPAAREIVVDPSDPAAFAEIDDAAAVAEDGDRILVRPGTYRRPVVVDRAVSIRGDGPRGAILLEPVGGEALGFAASGASVTGLTIRPARAGNDDASWSAAAVHDVAATIANCDLSSHLGATVVVGGPSSSARVVGCSIHDGAQNGVFVDDEGTLTIEGTTITGHRWPGVMAQGVHVSATVRDSKVHDNRDWGIAAQDGATLIVERTSIERNAQGGVVLHGAAPASRIEDCDLTENADVAVLVQAGCGGTVTGNRIRRNDAGVVVVAGATPTVSGNQIAGNGGPGIGVHVAGTDPVVTDNTVAAGQSVAIGVSGGAHGRFERNRVAAGVLPGIWVKDADTRPTFSDNTVAGGRSVGVTVSDGARGSFSRNDLRGNAGGSWDLAGAGALERTGNLEDTGVAPGADGPASPGLLN